MKSGYWEHGSFVQKPTIASEILKVESYGVRFGIEEAFKNLKDIYDWGKQELCLAANFFAWRASSSNNKCLFSMPER